ncbi:CoA synthetase [Rhodobacteraceae bacterium NNCM2]|nr:CoA synthetase [Coraliihabitans acroporae]
MTGARAFDPISVEEIAAAIPDGALLGVPADYSGVPMAFTRALIRRGARDLRLFCLPFSTIQADMLIGAGAVRSVEAAAVTLGEYGLAPRFCKAVEAGAIEMRDSTCPALHAQLQASEKAVPFMPLRGLIGSDILAHRPDWRMIDNPMGNEPDPIVLLPATTLDAAVFHAAKADRDGNIWIGRRRELATMAHGARKVFVTVEEITDEDLFETEASAACALPAFYVDGIAVAPKGAAPCGMAEIYDPDGEALTAYARAARTEEGFAEWLANDQMATA